MSAEDYNFPEEQSDAYKVIEISMVEGRFVEAKNELMRAYNDRGGGAKDKPKLQMMWTQVWLLQHWVIGVS